MDQRVRKLYIQYLKQGLSPKEAAKMVQKTTGMSAVTGKPLKKPEPAEGEYRGQYNG